jgi:hypothetical protein
MTARAEVLRAICSALTAGERERAVSIARSEYPRTVLAKSARRYGAVQSTRVFLRDGFIDRYGGAKLVFPGALRIVSRILPEEFPLHPNWKMSECHSVYWELSPTIDHLLPVARGGADEEANWVTTSMLRNAGKANWTLVELGWQLLPPGSLQEWDGLLDWFREYLKAHPSHLEDSYVRRWHMAAMRVAEKPNKAPEPTTMAVTSRAPSSTSRASHGRGSS